MGEYMGEYFIINLDRVQSELPYSQSPVHQLSQKVTRRTMPHLWTRYRPECSDPDLVQTVIQLKSFGDPEFQ